MQTAALPFPGTYRHIPLPALIDVYARGPERVRRAIAGLSDEQLRARPRPGKWAILEIIAHLTDSELIGAGRMRFAFAQPGVSLAGYDQTLWARRHDYLSFDAEEIERTLVLFAELRALMLCVFRRATDLEWAQEVSHSEFGALSLRNLLELYADHVERHLSQILVQRALLGAPLDLPLLLPERLY